MNSMQPSGYTCKSIAACQIVREAQIATGIDPPASTRARGEDVLFFLSRSVLRYFHQIPHLEDWEDIPTTIDSELNYRDLIAAAIKIPEAGELIISGVQAKLSRRLGAKALNIDGQDRRIHMEWNRNLRWSSEHGSETLGALI
ncbi:polyketide synthase, putative [Glarea lozoyensis ATCC 20868]|uniref:Polyketide synthase, putative n=1 Tax=Glarea lozoyensis (strain ATCC 20868 / MF5171) TaxID=1116229 RepID=S3DAY3_GLAL2|nr:polyketide synthase, putative [Glarea lozoyensis ATCC 20868]EPE35632.1 polyketide synthase, putative [Glarea lozoyensis ATCC 20868]